MTNDIEQRLPIGATIECDHCGAENISGQVHCAVCRGLVRDV